MKVTDAKLLISAVSSKQYPQGNFPEIALAGRSNVGKSSFINRLIQRKNLVRTSSKPGKTQTLNFYQINGKFIFVDVPGYGYAKISKSERKKWGQMMEEYFEERTLLQAVVLIVDSRHDPSPDDIQMYNYLKHHHHPVIVIATKIDKVSKNKRQNSLKKIEKVLQMEEEDSLVLFSAETGEGKDVAWKSIKRYLR